MRFRSLEWSDFDGWAALYFSRYDEIAGNPQLGLHFVERKPSLGEEAASFGQVWKRVQERDQPVSLAEEDGRLVGICTIYRGGHLEDRHVGTLAVAVLPDWRGRGIGSGLLDHALRGCESWIEMVVLEVIAVNEQALRLYGKFGFKECGRTPRAFKRNGTYYDVVRMAKHLGPP
ncbi:MAG: GNAT family N-acetyltransferase [Thermoplasmata archaeon]|nr:GNAT family N-acetyltransferase [Thermoplasmata archaeon]